MQRILTVIVLLAFVSGCAAVKVELPKEFQGRKTVEDRNLKQ